jgi:hypothetical protein
MSTPINAMLNGTFTSDANRTPVFISLPSGATEIKIRNETDYTAHAASIIEASGQASSTANTAVVYTGSGANPNVITTTNLLTGGFTFVSDSAGQSPGPAIAISGINQLNHPLALSATTGAIGDVVRVYGTTGMLQIAGMDFSVTAVNGGVSQTLGFLDSSGFSAPATAGFYRKLPYAGISVTNPTVSVAPRFYPRARYITGITAANPAVVTMSVAHNFQVGEKVRIIVPPEFGMVEMNNLLGTVTAVAHSATVNSITLDIDASAFTAFAFPTSALAALGIKFAQVVPVGEAAVNTIALPVGNSLDDATRNASINGVIVDTSVLVASKTYSWIAKKGITI